MALIEPGSPVAERLATSSMGWLTTMRADGQPQSSYIWFHFDGTDLLVFSRPGRPKVANVQANPLVSFHLDGDGYGGQVLTIDARAELLADGVSAVDPGRVQAYLAKYDDPIRNRLESTPEEMMQQFSDPLRVTPTRVRSW
jgi:PPOX class probable F420-dependent enzyme